MASPCTSVILCTRDRPESFQRALAAVLAQDVLDFELLVIDGSRPALEPLRDAPVPLRWVSEERNGEGAARALGLRLARGEVIAWCDDDEQWAPEHLRVLRAALLDSPGAVLAVAPVEREVHFSGNRRSGSGLMPDGFRFAASDLVHYAEPARRLGGFDSSLQAFAARDLWARMLALGSACVVEHVLTTPVPAASLVLNHRRNAALRRVQREWSMERRQRHATDQRLQVRARESMAFNRGTWCDGRREMILQSSMLESVSFAVVALALNRQMRDLGVRVATGSSEHEEPGPGWEEFSVPSIEPRDRLALVYEAPNDLPVFGCERVVRYAMWETTIIPRWQVEDINATVMLLYVPCHECARIAVANGIQIPVRVLHHGVDAERFPYLERPRAGDEPFVFGCFATLQSRKGTDVLIRAFLEEFRPDEPARLALRHTHDQCREYAPDDPRITLDTGFLAHEQLLEYLRGLDAFVLPTRGEGFGLTALEAMATGLPLIATNWSGPADYLDPADTYPLDYTLVDTGGLFFGFRRQFGEWAEPDIAHLRRLMRHVYDHRDEARLKGRLASARAHRDWGWERPARRIIEDFDLLAEGISPVSE